MKQHPYILATAIATLLAIAVWLCVPTEYRATTEVSDEYKEVELAIGLNSQKAYIRNITKAANKSLNNMESYSKLLKTDDFARSIAQKQVPGKGMTYGEYIGADDTIEVVKSHIEYNYHWRNETLVMGFTDRDPVVASQMLDSVTHQLQTTITSYRHYMADADLKNAEKELQLAGEKYKQAQVAFASFSDSNANLKSARVQEEARALEQELSLAYKHYEETTTQYARHLALKQRSYLSFTVIKANSIPHQPKKHLIGYILCFVLTALALTCARQLYAKRKAEGIHLNFGGLFSPWTITIGVWVSVFLLLSLYGNKLDPLSTKFYIDISIWITILSLTSFATYNLMAAKSHSKVDTIEVNKVFFYTFYIIAMVFTPMYIYQIYKLVIMFDTKDLMAEVRELAVHGEGFGILGYTFVINEAMLLVAMWRYPKIPLWQLITIIIANIMYAFGNMEKTTFFLVFTSTVFVLYEKGKIKLRSILVGSGVILVLFYIFNIARSGEDTEYAKNESLLDFIGMYVLAAPVAYGRLQETISDMFGPNSLYTFHYFYNKFFGGGNVPYQQFQDFVYVPISTNVYTLLRPYYTDFGHMGIAAFAAIYGVMTGFAYRLMKNGNAFGTCLYTYFVYVLVLQFFDDFITVSLSQFSHLLILLTLITQQSIRLSANRK